MILERREFLKLMGVAAGSVGMAGCGRRWSVPDHLVDLALRGPGLESEMQTICGLCGGGCGVSVRLVDGLPVGLRGNPHHPLNRGGLCPVGQAGLDVLYAPTRLMGPMRRGEDGALEPVDWDSAVGEISTRLQSLRAADDGHRLAVLVGEHDALLADLATRFAARFGSPNVARLEAPDVTPYYLSQGVDEIPGADLQGSDLVLAFGVDLLEDGAAPLHAIASLIGTRASEDRASLLHVGTRLSPTASKADEHVTIRPGTYAAFALGLAHILVREGRYDARFVAERTFGFDDWTDGDGRGRLGFRRLLIERYYPDRVAAICGVEAATIARVARRFADATAPLALAGGEATQATNATWSVLAVQALNALTGAFGRSEGGLVHPSPIPFNPLPAMPGPAADRAESVFSGAIVEGALGVDPVQALADGVLSGTHPVELLVIIGGNPVFESVAGSRLREAIERIPLVVSLTPFGNETSNLADIVLPTHVPLEDWRASATPSGVAFSALGIAQPVIEPLLDTRGAGDLLLQLTKVAEDPAGADTLSWSTYEEYLRDRVEGLAISGEGAIVTGSFEESWKHFLEERGWRFQETRRAEDLWRDLIRQAGWWNPVHPSGDWVRLFRTPTGRYEFYSNRLEAALQALGKRSGESSTDGDGAIVEGARSLGLKAEKDELCLPHYEPPVELGEGELSLVLFRPITARGSLGSQSRMVMEMFGYPVLSGWQSWIELTPETASHHGFVDGDLVRVTSERGTVEAVVTVRPGTSSTTAHMPLGLGHEDETAGRRIGSNPLEIVPTAQDPLSGGLAMGPSKVHLELVRRRQHGGPAPWHGGEEHNGEVA